MESNYRLVLAVAILASFVAFLDGSVVNVALPAMMRDLSGGLLLQQWIVDAYLITLGSLILIAGSLSDLLGRVRIMKLGLWGFGITSLLCAFAPDGGFLIISRALQGVAGALLVPSSLALIISSIKGKAQGKAIGTWTAWTGIAFIVGPLLGGFLVDALTWRFIFAINVLPIAVTIYLLRRLPQDKPDKDRARLDVWGAVLSSAGLGGSVYALIEHSRYGWGSWMIVTGLAGGILALIVFLWHERRVQAPMLPLELFKTRNFSAGNLATLMIYAALSIATFLISVFVQQVSGYSAIEAGLALLPVTLLMFFLSPRIGALSARFGPRLFMTIGPIVAGCGFLLMLGVGQHFNYWTRLMPGVIIFGLGLSITVSPLTSAILGSVDSARSGIASAVNNAVARIAGLIGIACIGIFMGARINVAGFHRGLVVMAILLFLGGLISFAGIRNQVAAQAED
jgi:EmrB/QacA subfamily drug resistance transporter